VVNDLGFQGAEEKTLHRRIVPAIRLRLIDWVMAAACRISWYRALAREGKVTLLSEAGVSIIR
jgi:hypothetical protein